MRLVLKKLYAKSRTWKLVTWYGSKEWVASSILANGF